MCVASLHCESQELKPKVETNTSFLVLRTSSGVDTIKAVGSHLNSKEITSLLIILYQGCNKRVI